MQGRAAPQRMELAGDRITTVTDIRGGDVQLACTLADLKVDLTDETSAQMEAADPTARAQARQVMANELSRRFYVTHRADGGAVELWLPRGTNPAIANIWLTLAGAAQLVRPSKPSPAWIVQERDTNGVYTAAYRETAPNHFTKQKAGYLGVQTTTAVAVRPGMNPASADRTVPVVRVESSSFDLSSTPSGRLLEMNGRETLNVEIGGLGLSFKVTVTVALADARTTQETCRRSGPSRASRRRWSVEPLEQAAAIPSWSLRGVIDCCSPAPPSTSWPRRSRACQPTSGRPVLGRRTRPRCRRGSRPSSACIPRRRDARRRSCEPRRHARPGDPRRAFGGRHGRRGPTGPGGGGRQSRDADADASLRGPVPGSTGRPHDGGGQRARQADGRRRQAPGAGGRAGLRQRRLSPEGRGPRRCAARSARSCCAAWPPPATSRDGSRCSRRSATPATPRRSPALRRIIENPKEPVRASAVQALRFIDDPAVDPLLTTIIKQKTDESVRLAAISAVRVRQVGPFTMTLADVARGDPAVFRSLRGDQSPRQPSPRAAGPAHGARGRAQER